MAKVVFFMLVLLFAIDLGYSRFITTTNDSGFVSDGLNHDDRHSSYLSMTQTVSSSGTCEPMYGFLPCAVNIWGHLYLIVVYQFLLYLGDSYVSSGSELLFTLLGPGIFGASAFQILESLPHAILVLASGIAGSPETAQAQVVSGVAILAGSTVYLLTVLWGTCVVIGRVGFSEGVQSLETEASKPSSIFSGSGITTDVETTYTARIMILSIVPFVIAQSPHFLGSTSSGNVATLVALVVSVIILLVYCIYQVFQPWIQNRKHEFMLQKFVNNVLLEKLVTSDRRPNVPTILELFKKIDQNNDNSVTLAEIKGLILGIQFQEGGGLEKDDVSELVLKEFNLSDDGRIDQSEFVRGISKWISDTIESKNRKVARKCRYHTDPVLESEEKKSLLVTQANTTEQTVQNSITTYFRALSFLLLGTIILLILASPLIESVINFSDALNIPSIYISYILVPFVSNYRRTLSAISNAEQKSQQSASLTLSEIYSSVFMNNIVGVTTFLGVVYGQGLVWDFSAAVSVIVVLCLVIGMYSTLCTIFPLWTSLVAYLLYPFSLVLLYVLSYTYG
ncbi:hypothetical protein ACHQM5_018071 [Ranunculus cassubicifolius]